MTDRRTALRLAAAAMLLPLLPARAAARFAPPAGPMRYARRLERDLGDGASFVVARDFAVRFVPSGTGYRVEGTQAGVAVEAPEKLAAFARMERERVEASLFPLVLDADGRIAGRPAWQPAEQLDEALREATARIGRQAHDPAAREDLERFVGAVHQGRLLAELPGDLFAPSGGPRVDRREVALPGGGTGVVTATFSATADPATGLMREARREVLTELSGDLRRTVETWHLAPL